MNSERAKFILGAYRPNHADQDDPEIKEALALAREDDGLRQWLEEQMKFDRGMMERLRGITPPDDLYGNVLHGVGVTSRGAEEGEVAGRIWARPEVRAMAAMLAVGLFVGVMIWAPRSVKDRSGLYASLNCRDCAVEVIDDLHAGVARLDLKTGDVGEVKEFMAAAHSASLPVGVVDLDGVKLMGCKEIKSRGGTVTIVCFRQDGKLFHLATFEIKSPKGNEIPEADALRVTHHGDLLAATWREGSVGRMLLTSQSDADEGDVERVVRLLTV